MLEHASGTASFFRAMAPVLIANVLTVGLRLLLREDSPKGTHRRGRGSLTYLWLIIVVLLFMLYGLYTWGFILGKAAPAPL
jgi:hypothetical protein